MNFSRTFIVIFFLSVTISKAFAQNNVGPLMLDPAFANGGKSEISFGQDSAVATSFVAIKPLPRQLNRILVAGKIFTSSPGAINFGVVEYDSSGSLETGFGNNGKVDINWNGYPNALTLIPNGTIVAAGATGVITFGQFGIAPTVFRLKADGAPDSSFGANGIVRDFAGGEFLDIDTLHVGSGDSSLRYLATGYGANVDSDIQPVGFCALRLKANGIPDSSFGGTGLSFEQLGFLKLFAQGHLVAGNEVMFAGVASTGFFPEIILYKLRANGTPDSSFGTNGVLYTGISLHGGNKLLSIYNPDSAKPDPYRSLMVAAPVADSSAGLPFTILKFKLNGTLDSNYGQNGYATAPVISSMSPNGLTLTNDASILVCGSVGNVSAATKFFPWGAVDSSFGTNGVALLDADSGLRKNFLIGFLPASLPPPHPSGGGQRFLGIGTSANASGNDEFLLARYMPVRLGVGQPSASSASSVELYPNPAHSFVNIESASGTIERITIADALGRIVENFSRPSYSAQSMSYFLDVSNISSGTYNCIVQTVGGISSERFTVMH